MTARIFCPSLSLSLPSHGSAISFLVHKLWAKRFHFFGGKCEEFGQLGQRTMAALACLGKKTFSACWGEGECAGERHCSGRLCQLTSLVSPYLFCSGGSGRTEGRRKEMLLLTQQRQLFEVKRPTDRASRAIERARKGPSLPVPFAQSALPLF